MWTEIKKRSHFRLHIVPGSVVESGPGMAVSLSLAAGAQKLVTHTPGSVELDSHSVLCGSFYKGLVLQVRVEGAQ